MTRPEQSIAHFHILEKLGEGGMGVVYLAEDMGLNRRVALKLLPPQLLSDDLLRKRLVKEAQAVASLNHPNVCSIHSVGEHEDRQYIEMEYVDGVTLRQRLATGALGLEEAVRWAIQSGEALQEAHSHGIVHRDIKPENIMIDSRGQIKVMDFGLATLTGNFSISRPDSTPGTLAYMSPEQIQGGHIDVRSDLFSFGIVFFEMLTGHRPFRGDYAAAMLYSILNEQPEPLAAHLFSASLQLQGLFERLLQKRPEDRYGTAEEMLGDLRCALPSSHAQAPLIGRKPFRAPHRNSGSRNRGWLFTSLTVAALAAAVACFYLFLPANRASGPNANTIAVLPLVNLSGKAEDEYFADGITEDILTHLCKYADLNVISRTTVMQYKSARKTMREIGEELGAGAVLEGSVRRSGNRIRITSQLIDAGADRHLWAETYDRELSDVLRIQSEIAGEIASALRATLSDEVSGRGGMATDTDPEAYNLLLKGRYHSSTGTREGYEKAIAAYGDALALDAEDARVWAALSEVYCAQAGQVFVLPADGFERAREAARKALSLDPRSAEARTTLGRVLRDHDWDWRGADAEFRKALALLPGDELTVANVAALAATLGRFDEAIALERKSITLNPLHPAHHCNLGFDLMYAGRLEEAASALRTAVKLDPAYPSAHYFLGCVFLLKGENDSAMTEMRKETDDSYRAHGVVLAMIAAGRTAQAKTAMREYEAAHGAYMAYQIAQQHAYAGAADRAFDWLQRAHAQRDAGLTTIKGDPFLKKIEKDARYPAFMKQMKLADE